MAALLAGLAVCWPAAAPAQSVETPTIVKIEEDWTIVIGVPEPDGHAPQIINVISPDALNPDLHAVFECNHSTQPVYTPGGMQLQTWNGENLVESRSFPHSALLGIPGETITYTLVMNIKDNRVEFEVRNGQSQTWGTFGGQGYLKTSIATSLGHLNGYDPESSVRHSRVGFAAHRVQRFSLKAVRVYTSSGLYGTDTTERVVDLHSDGE